MAQRAFKYFTITAGGTPQPLIGTLTTAAILALPAGASPSTPVSVPVSDSSMFLKGDWVIVDNSGTPERAFVFGVPDGTHVQLTGLQLAHASGSTVSLSILVNNIYVQTKDGNAGAIFIGTSGSMVKASGVSVITKLQQVAVGVQPTEFSSAMSGMGLNPIDVGQIWIDGTTADSYLPSLGIV